MNNNDNNDQFMAMLDHPLTRLIGLIALFMYLLNFILIMLK
jgi:hypothetical protein